MSSPRRPARGSALAIAWTAVVASVIVALLGTAPAAAGNTFYLAGSACTKSSTPVWQSGDTWILYGDVRVVVGCTLTIEPGATVKADPNVDLFVDGTLLSDGVPGTPVTYVDNQTVGMAWSGIQFTAGSSGSLSWSTFQRVQVAVFAQSSSPAVHNNTIEQASAGVRLDNSNSLIVDNRIDGVRFLSFGIFAVDSDTTLARNTINGTAFGIQATGGRLSISSNTITNTSGAPALAIYLNGLISAVVDGNTIQDVAGTAGGPGAAGNFAVGILVNGTASVQVMGNLVSQVRGGRGGNGANSAVGVGGSGGMGGSAVGIAVANADSAVVQGNTVDAIEGNRGGNGGSSGASNGGPGGDGGYAFGLQGVVVTSALDLSLNTVTDARAGGGGDGGAGGLGANPGRGGAGADATGIFIWQGMDAGLSSDWVETLLGGAGGNSTANSGGATSGTGGRGGQATGISLVVDGTPLVHSTTVTDLLGGAGGNGLSYGGAGGNATGILALGDGAPYNVTTASGDAVSSVTGGAGGVGVNTVSGDGGAAAGIMLLHVNASLTSDSILTLQGGDGGPAFSLTNPASRGGDAAGIAFLVVPDGSSMADSVQGITKGAAGTGRQPAPSYGVGYYFMGEASAQTRAVVTNATLASVGDFDLYVDNYTEATAVNTPFAGSMLAVMSAGNLTVRNLLEVDVLWPDTATYVAGATIEVDDNGLPVYSFVSSTGQAPWLLVTDRVHINSDNPTENITTVRVTYAGYSFANEPRDVDMSSSHAESFTMIDTTPPTSAAGILPPYENTLAFAVPFMTDDGFGVGVKNVTLWYRYNGGAWTSYATLILPSGPFAFTAAADGLYEFATTAYDTAGNGQQPRPPTANDTWTIVDTTRPGSHVNPLPAYETTLTFTVSWAPDSGVDDIDFYSIQYNSGGTWVTWLGDTRATSAAFTASGQGLYQFRSIAHDLAGNAEIATSTNDTWTIVDTLPAASSVASLPTYETNGTFAVSWGPAGGSTDVGSYSIEVSADAAPWTTWLASVTNTSAIFTGLDGHRYAFRSIATDRAGNVESKGSANDTWTFVDVTPPSSAVNGLPAYEASLTFTIGWGPRSGTADVATYTVQVSDDGGPWTPLAGYVDTTSTSAVFSGNDGHAYAFRSLAKDRAGNVESKGVTNDTWTVVDVTRPYVQANAPEGAGTGLTPSITVTFSEPMDPLSTRLAFTISPAMNGNFTWSADGRTLTFIPERSLQPGTPYVVVIDTSAKDLAGNGLAAPKTFSFTTAASGLALGDLWPVLLAVIAAVVGGTLFLIYRRRSAASTAAAKSVPPPAPASSALPAAIDDVFLLYGRDGILIKHETRRLRPDIDTDILSGMLTAVQQFVKDSFRGEEGEELNEMTVGQMHILIGRGKWLILAAMVTGGDTPAFTNQIRKCIQDMEDHHWDQLEDWDGDMAFAKVLTPYVKKLIRGEYAEGALRQTAGIL